MAEPTFVVYIKHSAAGTEETVTAPRLWCSSGNGEGLVTNPVRIPASGTYRSYCMVLAPGCSSMGDASNVTDWEMYTDAQGTVESALGTGVSIKVCTQDEDLTTAQYTEATGSGSGATLTGTPATTLYSGIVNTMDQIYTYVTASRKTLNSQITSGTGEFTDWLVFQAEVADTASYGQAGPINVYFACLVS